MLRSDVVRIQPVDVTPIGATDELFDIAWRDRELVISLKKRLPGRCTLRPAAMFRQDRGFPDVNTVMGRIVFTNGATQPQRYQPFTHDPHRKLRELFLPVESVPDDDWPVSVARWRNYEAITKRLLENAGIPWEGLTNRDVDELVRYIVWPEPLEGCILHALVQHKHALGPCVVEIGSFRGRSLSMLAMGLRRVQSEAKLISIDPYEDQPHNAEHVRLSLRQIGEENRLVQMQARSNAVWSLLRPQCASLIFIDGNHSFQNVVDDFHNYRELLAPGGYMVFHDYGYGNHNGRPEADPDVRRAVDEHVFPAPEFSPLLLAHTEMVFIKSS